MTISSQNTLIIRSRVTTMFDKDFHHMKYCQKQFISYLPSTTVSMPVLSASTEYFRTGRQIKVRKLIFIISGTIPTPPIEPACVRSVSIVRKTETETEKKTVRKNETVRCE